VDEVMPQRLNHRRQAQRFAPPAAVEAKFRLAVIRAFVALNNERIKKLHKEELKFSVSAGATF